MKISKKRTVVKVFACILCIGIGTLSGIIPSMGAENVSDIEQINTFSPESSQKADNEVQRDNGLTKSSKCDSCKRAHTPQIKHHSQQFYRKKQVNVIIKTDVLTLSTRKLRFHKMRSATPS